MTATRATSMAGEKLISAFLSSVHFASKQSSLRFPKTFYIALHVPFVGGSCVASRFLDQVYLCIYDSFGGENEPCSILFTGKTFTAIQFLLLLREWTRQHVLNICANAFGSCGKGVKNFD